MRRERPTSASDGDPFGMDERGRGNVTKGLRALVPQRLARLGLAVDVATDRSTYDRDETVEITIEIRNRLPLPVSLAIEGKRIWGWTVDGKLGASDEPRHAAETRRRLDLRPFERRHIRRTWHCRFKRQGSPTRWIPAPPGEYEIGAFVATAVEPTRGSTTVTLR